MYCKYCGKEIDDDSKFCKNCGNELVETQKGDNMTRDFCKKFRKSDIKYFFSTTYLGTSFIIGCLAYLFALTFSSELLHVFGLSRGKQLNENISICIGIITVIVAEIKLFISFKNDIK